MLSSSSSSSLIQKVKRRALDDGKLFSANSLAAARPKMNIPQPRCGFDMKILRRKPIICRPIVDPSMTVSLALVHQYSPILDKYGNKLNIMTINVSRFEYTVEAFWLRNNQQTSCLNQALSFYVSTDIKYQKTNEPPNKLFSDLLHRLRTNGYEDYIFDLATTLNLNVDLIYDNNCVLVYRFIKVDKIGSQTNTGIGYLTAIHNESNWYVQTTTSPIIETY